MHGLWSRDSEGHWAVAGCCHQAADRHDSWRVPLLQKALGFHISFCIIGAKAIFRVSKLPVLSKGLQLGQGQLLPHSQKLDSGLMERKKNQHKLFTRSDWPQMCSSWNSVLGNMVFRAEVCLPNYISLRWILKWLCSFWASLDTEEELGSLRLK